MLSFQDRLHAALRHWLVAEWPWSSMIYVYVGFFEHGIAKNLVLYPTRLNTYHTPDPHPYRRVCWNTQNPSKSHTHFPYIRTCNLSLMVLFTPVIARPKMIPGTDKKIETGASPGSLSNAIWGVVMLLSAAIKDDLKAYLGFIQLCIYIYNI